MTSFVQLLYGFKLEPGNNAVFNNPYCGNDRKNLRHVGDLHRKIHYLSVCPTERNPAKPV